MKIEEVKGYDVKKSVAASTFFFTVTGVVTGLIPTPFYVRMVPITFLDYTFLFTTSILAGIYFGKEKCTVTDSRLSALGGVTGFLAFSCPICNGLLLAFLSTSAIMAYVDPLRPLLGVISTLVLGYLMLKSQDG
ncbi:hypothetical protein ACK3SF_01850 [Candidatus Nanosalina sp. VS9-1]|uniref:hypothetical protein n=1 Tax=Candidatus Nanosalina sp. VS9-1 TaxID=3388566 RepID=UPI0039E19D4E